MKTAKDFSFGAILLLFGICLAGFAWFAPDATGRPGAFFKAAVLSTWLPLFKFGLAWCGLKIILFSVGLFLAIESVASLLVRCGRRQPARLVYGLHILSCAGVLLGGFCLVKALF